VSGELGGVLADLMSAMRRKFVGGVIGASNCGKSRRGGYHRIEFASFTLKQKANMTADNPIVWTVCNTCGEQITTHKAICNESLVPSSLARTMVDYTCPICFSKNMPDLGPRCAIICTGTSVRNYEPSLLSKITVPTIGVNWSYLGVQSLIHVVSNIEFIHKHKHEFETITPGTKYRISPMWMEGAYVPHKTLSYSGWMSYTSMKRNGTPVPPFKPGYNLYRDGWVFCGGGPQGLIVAITFGFKEITFVGLDLDTGDTCHFYENDPDKSTHSGYSRAKLDKAWIIQKSYFEQVKPSLDELGLRVRNLGRSDIFERGDWGEIT
jgi:hypothetical protein